MAAKKRAKRKSAKRAGARPRPGSGARPGSRGGKKRTTKKRSAKKSATKKRSSKKRTTKRTTKRSSSPSASRTKKRSTAKRSTKKRAKKYRGRRSEYDLDVIDDEDEEDDDDETGPDWMSAIQRIRAERTGEIEVEDDDEEDLLDEDAAPAKKATKRVSPYAFRGTRSDPFEGDVSEIDRLLDRLDLDRISLFKEWRRAIKEIKKDHHVEPAKLCTREYNQMRMSDLEALSIVRAFEREPHLIRRKAQVIERARAEAARLKKSKRRQNYTCPLLEGDQCLVHQHAKPIGCLAFNAGDPPTESGQRAFRSREKLNERAISLDWSLRAIPLQLATYFESGLLEPGKIMIVGPQRRKKKTKKKRSKKKSARKKQTTRGRRGSARHESGQWTTTPTRGRGKTRRGKKGASRGSSRRRRLS